MVVDNADAEGGDSERDEKGGVRDAADKLESEEVDVWEFVLLNGAK